VNGRRATGLESRDSSSLPPLISLGSLSSTTMDSPAAEEARTSRLNRLVAATNAQDLLRVLDALRELEKARELFAINDAGEQSRRAAEG
jgi:hypothetical protein